jgi:hypothetical protein
VPDRVDAMSMRLGIPHNPKKGVSTPTQVDNHLGLTIDLHKGESRAPIDKLHTMAKQASSLLSHAATSAR